MDKIFLVIPEKIGTVAPEIYGVFCEHIGSVIYGGIYSPNAKGEGYIRGFRKKIIDCMAFMKMKIATPIDMSGSIIARSVKRMTIAPTRTISQPRTSSSICRLTAR